MKKTLWWGISFILIVAVVWYFSAKPGENDDFAKCLTEKGVKMYGAYWCPHCQREKAAFGDSFNYVPYVECTEEPGTTQCTAAGITGYPTWITADGRRFEGEQGIVRLSEASSCPLPDATLQKN